MNKKGDDMDPLHMVGSIIIVAVILAIAIIYGPQLYKKIFKGAETTVCSTLNDFDNDNIPDTVDTCKCNHKDQATYAQVDGTIFPDKKKCESYKYNCDTISGNCLPLTEVLSDDIALCGQRENLDTGTPGDAKLKIGHMMKDKTGELLTVCATDKETCDKLIAEKCQSKG